MAWQTRGNIECSDIMFSTGKNYMLGLTVYVRFESATKVRSSMSGDMVMQLAVSRTQG